MKNSLLSVFVMLLYTSAVQGQTSFKAEPNPAIIYAPQTEFDNPAKSFIFNLTNSKLNIKWERTEVSVPAGLQTQVCDPNLCWIASISSKTFEIEAKDTANMDVHFVNPNAIKASAIVHLKITNVDKPSETATVVYLFNPTSGTQDLPPATVRLFPNPVANFFTLEKADDVSALRLFSLDGRQFAHWSVSPDQTYPLDHQPAGKYLLALEEKNGRVFQLIEIVKN